MLQQQGVELCVKGCLKWITNEANDWHQSIEVTTCEVIVIYNYLTRFAVVKIGVLLLVAVPKGAGGYIPYVDT